MFAALIVGGLKVAGAIVVAVLSVKVTVRVGEAVRQWAGGGGRRQAHVPNALHNPTFEKETFIQQLPPALPYAGPLVSHNPLGWQVDRAVLEQMMAREYHLRDDLELGAGLLISSLQQNRNLDKYNKYSSTFASSVLDVYGNFTPEDAIKAFAEEFDAHGMSNRAIYILGGLFIVGTEAERRVTENRLRTLQQANQRWGRDRMARGTPQDTSRLTWKLTVYRPWSGDVTAMDLVRGVRAIATSNPQHGMLILSPTVINNPPPMIVHPTTMYGASATIMKVMKKCEALGMDQRQCKAVAFAVAQHWLDKHLNDRRDRHSLLEALQGALTYLGYPEDQANRMMEQEIRRLGANLYGNPMQGYIPITNLGNI